MGAVGIGLFQLLTLLANLVYGKAIGFTSEALARSVGRDAWLAMFIAFLTGLPMIALSVWLARRFGAAGPSRYIPRLLGRPLGVLALLLLALFFFGAFITSAITIELHINDYLMTETPLAVFVVLYTALCAFAVHLGIEVAARLSVMGLLFFVLLDLLMIAGSVDHLDLSRLLPLADRGVLPVAASSLAAGTDVAMATAGALLLLPLVGQHRRRLGACWWGLALGGTLVLVWPVFEIGVLGPEVTAQYLIACMQLARAAELSIYLHRYELVMVVVFVYGVLTQSTVCLWCACELTGAALPLRVRRPALIVACALLTLVPHYLLAHDRDRYGLFLATWWPAVAVPIAYGIPLLVALVALARPGVSGDGHRADRRAGGADELQR